MIQVSKDVEHLRPNPFPYYWVQRKVTILDEDCYCGHRRSSHFDTLAFGHANCSMCNCAKYTWKAFVVKPDATKSRKGRAAKAKK